MWRRGQIPPSDGLEVIAARIHDRLPKHAFSQAGIIEALEAEYPAPKRARSPRRTKTALEKALDLELDESVAKAAERDEEPQRPGHSKYRKDEHEGPVGKEKKRIDALLKQNPVELEQRMLREQRARDALPNAGTEVPVVSREPVRPESVPRQWQDIPSPEDRRKLNIKAAALKTSARLKETAGDLGGAANDLESAYDSYRRAGEEREMFRALDRIVSLRLARDGRAVAVDECTGLLVHKGADVSAVLRGFKKAVPGENEIRSVGHVEAVRVFERLAVWSEAFAADDVAPHIHQKNATDLSTFRLGMESDAKHRLEQAAVHWQMFRDKARVQLKGDGRFADAPDDVVDRFIDRKREAIMSDDKKYVGADGRLTGERLDGMVKEFKGSLEVETDLIEERARRNIGGKERGRGRKPSPSGRMFKRDAVDLSDGFGRRLSVSPGGTMAIDRAGFDFSIPDFSGMRRNLGRRFTSAGPMLLGGVTFGFSMVGADIVTDNWSRLRERNLKGFLREYSSLTAGNIIGRSLAESTLKALPVLSGAPFAGGVMKRFLSLAGGLGLLHATSGERFSLAGFGAGIFNCLLAGGIVHAAVGTIGGASLLVTAGLGIVTGIAEMVLIEKLGEVEGDVAEYLLSESH